MIGSKVAAVLRTKKVFLHPKYLGAVFGPFAEGFGLGKTLKNIYLYSKQSGFRICNFLLRRWLNPPAEKKICIFFWSSQTSLLCIVGELAEGGCFAVAVSDSDI